ncbi:MAG: hypothetical protein AABM66_11265 [Actinomycetota bacterium]
MLKRFRRRLTYANVMATIAAFGVLAGGGAYAATKIGSNDIRRNAVRSKHIKNGQVKRLDLGRGAVTRERIANGAVNEGKLDSNSKARWAVVTNGGDLVRERGVVASESIGTAVYEVTFNRDVSECAWSATLARNVDAAPVPGEIGVRPPTDNPNGVVVHTWNSAGAPSINRFHLVVTC